MISKIYSCNTPIFRSGERKGKTKTQIERINDQRLNKKKKPKNLKSTQNKVSGFINCKQGYMNKGKYKGYLIDKVPLNYLIWVEENVSNLNTTERKLLLKTIRKKLK